MQSAKSLPSPATAPSSAFRFFITEAQQQKSDNAYKFASHDSQSVARWYVRLAIHTSMVCGRRSARL